MLSTLSGNSEYFSETTKEMAIMIALITTPTISHKKFAGGFSYFTETENTDSKIGTNPTTKIGTAPTACTKI